MTPEQLATLAADIATRPACAPYRDAPIDAPAIAAIYNAPSNPAVALWRPDVKVFELNAVANWVAFAAATPQKQNTYFAMTQGGICDARLASMRQGFAQVWPVAADQAPLVAASQRTGTVFEVLFSTANVSTVFGQFVTADDVHAALGT